MRKEALSVELLFSRSNRGTQQEKGDKNRPIQHPKNQHRRKLERNQPKPKSSGRSS